jgi:hypothetical protein
MDRQTYLQNEVKFTILTIGKLRNKLNSEYTQNRVLTKISGFFPIMKRNLYVPGNRHFTRRLVKTE